MITPADRTRITPFLPVRNMEAALTFYEDVLGLRRTNLNIEAGRLVHAELEADGRTVLMLAPDGLHSDQSHSPASRGATATSEIQAYVPSADAAHEAALAHGARSVEGPRSWPWGERHAHFIDPDGYHWLVAQVVK